ncbi:MAG: phage head closure protein [Pseudolabrys sp.]|jgi:SPP1 family predicted phage head-tail adaptor
MSALIDIGALNRRLVLQAPANIDDGAGGFTRDFETVAPLWGSVTTLSARAEIAADTLGAALRLRIVIRFRGDVTTRHRLLDGAHIYSLIAVRESEGRRFLEIDAEERQD